MYLWLLAPSKAKSNWSLPEDAALINTLGGKTEGLHSHLLGIYRFAPSMPRVEQQRTYKIAHGGNGQHRRTSRSYHQKLHQGTGDASFWLFVRPAAHGHGATVVCMDSVASPSDLDSGGKSRSGVTCKGCRLPFLTPAATALPRWSPLPTWALCSSRHHCIPDSRFDFVSFVTAFFYRRSYALTDNNLKKDYNA